MEMGQEPETMDNTDPALKEAIMEVLMQLLMESEAAHGEMVSNDLDGMKEVSVQADSEEGLEEGLEVAKEAVSDDDSEDEDDEDTMY